MIPKISCTHQSRRPRSNSSAAGVHAEKDADSPPLLDPNNHHRQQGFKSQWTGPLQTVSHMLMWHVDRWTSLWYFGPRSTAYCRQNSGNNDKSATAPPSDQRPYFRASVSAWSLALPLQSIHGHRLVVRLCSLAVLRPPLLYSPLPHEHH